MVVGHRAKNSFGSATPEPEGDNQFRGEVETIVGKALEKDKARRYASAGELGEDLSRHLAHEPIRARLVSSLYRARRFVDRNKGLAAGTAGRDRAVWLWDPASDQEIARLPGHTSYIWSLAFSPGGETLLSGSGDFSIRLWDTSPLARRYQARHEAELLRPDAERLVGKLFQEKKDAAEVAAVVRADRSLSEPQRYAALRTLLRR